MNRFNGKSILVTGGTAGIGRAIVEAFVAEGGQVLFTGRNAEAGETVAKATGARFLRADASVEADIKASVAATVDAFGKLDIAINNAGVEGHMAPVTEQTIENYRHTFDVNVLGVLLAMKHEIPELIKAGGGAIVNLSSIAGEIGMPGASVYIASKHAVNGLTRTAALEVAKLGIRVNAVSPGAIQTAMFERFTGGDEAIQQGFAASHPVGRAGAPAEVAQAVLYLSSDGAKFTTGITLQVDGGYTAQ